MKHSAFTKVFMLLAMTFFGTQAYSLSNIPLRKIKAATPNLQVNMLDSVKGDNYRKIYQYNMFGYITSVMVYHKDTDWSLDTGQSYVQDYTFNDDGQCTERTRYQVDEQGKRTFIEDQGKLEVKDGLTWEYTYEHNDDGKLHPVTAKAYDKWGNLSIDIEYSTDSYDYEDYISHYEEWRYAGHTLTEDHMKHSAFKNAYLTYHVKARLSDGNRIMDANQLKAGEFFKCEWTQENGKLYCRYYSYYDLGGTIGSIAQRKLDPTQEYVYELNADGTRPVSKKEIINGSYSNNCYTYLWDAKNRLTSTTVSNLDGEVRASYTYTYADDYAKSMSLMDAVYALDNNLWMYPEDEFCTFGRLSTESSEHPYDEYNKEQSTYTWNDNHQMILHKWKESAENYDSGTQASTQKEDNGEEHYFYNEDGHVSYLISMETENDGDVEYYKIEFVYDAIGNWIGEKSYYGESFDGPWTADNDNGHKVSARKFALKSASFTEDMSEGSHDIDANDGVFQTSGYYEVSEGVITGGYYQQYLISSASIPDNPELNYTEPAVPFEFTDDEDASEMVSSSWYYEWNSEAQEWKCMQASFGNRIYYNDDDIVCDTYNSEKQITSTITYSFDEEGRLAKQANKDCVIEYTYLSDGSDYLLETTTTKDGATSTLHYYYSFHNYVPMSIDDVKTATNTAPVYYDLQGRRIDNPSAHGIYIVNGKKVLK